MATSNSAPPSQSFSGTPPASRGAAAAAARGSGETGGDPRCVAIATLALPRAVATFLQYSPPRPAPHSGAAQHSLVGACEQRAEHIGPEPEAQQHPFALPPGQRLA